VALIGGVAACSAEPTAPMPPATYTQPSAGPASPSADDSEAPKPEPVRNDLARLIVVPVAI
jgi:hypothetical protein